MTHLSPYSYPARLFEFVSILIMVVILIKYVFYYDFLKGLLAKSDLKFYSYLLLLAHILGWILYDILSTIAAFEFMNMNEELRIAADIILNFVFTTHSSLMFLMISIWHVLLRKTLTGGNIFTKLEFKVYFGYSMFSLILYPTVQFSLWNEEPIFFVIIPQYIYFVEMLICNSLFVSVLFRLNRYLKNNADYPPTVLMIKVLFGSIVFLILANLCIVLPLTIINIPYLIGYLFHPFVSGYLTALFSSSYILMILTSVLILNVRQFSSTCSEIRNFTSRTAQNGTAQQI